MPSILTLDQLRCLGSPVRHRVFMALRRLEQASAAEVGVAVGKSAATMHYHLQALEKADLVRKIDFRPSHRRPEAIFTTTASAYQLPRAKDDATKQAMRRSAQLTIREAARTYDKVADQGRNLIIRTRVRVGSKDRKRFIELIESLARFARDHEDPDGETFEWLSIVYPGAKK